MFIHLGSASDRPPALLGCVSMESELSHGKAERQGSGRWLVSREPAIIVAGLFGHQRQQLAPSLDPDSKGMN